MAATWGRLWRDNWRGRPLAPIKTGLGPIIVAAVHKDRIALARPCVNGLPSDFFHHQASGHVAQ